MLPEDVIDPSSGELENTDELESWATVEHFVFCADNLSICSWKLKIKSCRVESSVTYYPECHEDGLWRVCCRLTLVHPSVWQGGASDTQVPVLPRISYVWGNNWRPWSIIHETIYSYIHLTISNLRHGVSASLLCIYRRWCRWYPRWSAQCRAGSRPPAGPRLSGECNELHYLPSIIFSTLIHFTKD